MKFRSGLLAAALLAAPLVAKAQPIPGPYVQLGLGGNLQTDEKIHSITIPQTGEAGSTFQTTTALRGLGLGASRHVRVNGGFAGQGAVGWSFGPLTTFGGPRVELEGLYTNNALRGRETGAFLQQNVNLGGTEQKFGALANAIWDFDLGIPYFYPYLGVGVGGVWSNWQSVRIYQFPNNFPNMHINDTVGGVGYQGIVGASFPIPAVPGLAVTADFRFLDLPDKRRYKAGFTGFAQNGQLAVNGPAAITVVNNHNFQLLLGVKYSFFAAPPPPPAPPPAPAPVVEPARSYLVFFDWDRYNLTDRARQIIREAAENSTRVQFTRIQVNGYTDTSGGVEYNQRLSVRRAQAVAAELVRNGVPRNAISIQGFGKTNLLVPTGDGVREPQNRRVEIIIQ